MEYVKVIVTGDLPVTVYGLTTYCFDEGQAYYTIFINAKLNAERQFETYKHEISHIDHNDFDHMTRVEDVESCRHNIA